MWLLSHIHNVSFSVSGLHRLFWNQQSLGQLVQEFLGIRGKNSNTPTPSSLLQALAKALIVQVGCASHCCIWLVDSDTVRLNVSKGENVLCCFKIAVCAYLCSRL